MTHIKDKLEHDMRAGFRAAGLFAILLGAWWVLQGTGLAPVGFMANQMPWAYRGIALIMLGGMILFFTRSKIPH